MDLSAIFSMARDLWYVSNVDKYTDANLLKYANVVYHQLENKIVSDVNEDYFYEIWTTDLVAWQNEYTFEPSTATAQGMKKLERLEIKWSVDDDYFKEVNPWTTNNTWYATDELEVKLDKLNAFFQIRDSSIFIFPKPTENVNNGLRLTSIVNLVDLTVNDTEILIFPQHSELRQYHPIIAFWIVPFIFRIQGKPNDAQIAQNYYEIESQKMIKEIRERYIAPVEAKLPNSYYYTH